jgi:hypothetical protein
MMERATDTRSEDRQHIEKFLFRSLHPKILIGTASDRYEWAFLSLPVRKIWSFLLDALSTSEVMVLR